MSKKTHGPSSLRALKKQCAKIKPEDLKQVFLISSPHTNPTLATAILCRTIARLRGTFHISFGPPIMTLDKVNEFRVKHKSSSIILVGIDTLKKKRLRSPIKALSRLREPGANG